MTLRAILGLAALNAGFAVLGLSILWALRWASAAGPTCSGSRASATSWAWRRSARSGPSCSSSACRSAGWAIVVTLVGGTLAAGVAGALLGQAPPEGFGDGRGSPTLDLLTMAAGIALIGLLLEALFRSARLQSLQAYDAWAFWVPKGKAIFFFGGLDEQIFTSLPGPTYPPLVPILDAAAFHAMGGVDTVTFHLQYWFLLLGAVAAIAGCLHRRVAASLLWPSLVLVLVLPRFGERLLTPQADVLVDVLFVVGALLLVPGSRDGESWRLRRRGRRCSAVGPSRSARACCSRRRRSGSRSSPRWPGGRPVACGSCSQCSRCSPPPSHGASGTGASRSAARRRRRRRSLGGSFDRVVDSLRLSFEVLFDSALWSVAPVVAIIALAAAAVWGDRQVAAFVGAVLGIVFVGGAWVTYSFVDIPITDVESVNPIVRYTSALVLLAVVATPLLLDSVWRGRGSGS